MDPIDKHHVYTLLCTVILADKKVLNVELETFIKVATGIQTALNDRVIDTPSDLQKWFDFNLVRISSFLLRNNWQANIAEHLKALSHVGYKWHIIQAMKSIAVSDNEFHSSEVGIIKFTIAYWDEEQADYLALDMQDDFSNRTDLDPSNKEISASRRPDDGT